MRRSYLMAVICANFLSSQPVLADLNQGQQAYRTGDYELAFRELVPYANQGNASAQYMVAEMLEGRKVRLPDYSAAFSFYEKAATQGHSEAISTIASMYASGWGGVLKNQNKESFWMKRLEHNAEEGDSVAQYLLGYKCLNRKPTTQEDYKNAFEWFKRSATQGHADAQRYMGVMYRYGYSVPRNRILAYAWYNVAAARSKEWKGDLDPLESEMTREEIRIAQKLSANWKPGTLITYDE